MALHEDFFSDHKVSQILGELIEIRRERHSWLGVTEAHYHDETGRVQSICGCPEWLIPVYHPQRGTLNCYKDYLDLSNLYEVAWTYINGKLRVAAYSTLDLHKGHTIEHSLLEEYLPRLQNYGSPVEIFSFNRELIKKQKLLLEIKDTHGTRLTTIDTAQITDTIPKGWYDWDYKVIICYSKDLVAV